MIRTLTVFILFLVLVFVGVEGKNAINIETSQGPFPPPQGSVSQASTPAQPPQPSIDHYKSLVEMAHKEVEWVRTVYIWLAGILGFIVTVGIGLAVFLTYKSINESRESINKQVELHMTPIKSALDARIQEMNKEARENINKSVHEEIVRVSNNLRNMQNIFPVIEYEFYKVESISLNHNFHFKDEFLEKLEKSLLEVLGGIPRITLEEYPYIVNEDKREFLVAPVYHALVFLDQRYKGYGNAHSNIKNTKPYRIPEDFKQIRSIGYVFYVSVFWKEGWESSTFEELKNRTWIILSNMQKISNFRIGINNAIIWEIGTLNLPLELTSTITGDPHPPDYARLIYTGNVDVQTYFKDDEKIKEAYIKGLLPESRP